MSYQSYINQALSSIYGKRQQRQDYGQQNQGYGGFAGQGYGGYNPLAERGARSLRPENPFNALVSQYAHPVSPISEWATQPGAIQGYNVRPVEFAQQATQPSALQTALQEEAPVAAQPSAPWGAMPMPVNESLGGQWRPNPLLLIEGLKSGKLNGAYERTYRSWLETWGYKQLESLGVPYERV